MSDKTNSNREQTPQRGDPQLQEHFDAVIDSMLCGEEQLVPSSGFVNAVMAAVREEADVPKPLEFPWKRFMLGFVLAIGVFAWAAIEFVRAGVLEQTVSAVGQAPKVLAQSVIRFNVPSLAALSPWTEVSMALCVAALALALPWILVRRMTRQAHLL